MLACFFCKSHLKLTGDMHFSLLSIGFIFSYSIQSVMKGRERQELKAWSWKQELMQRPHKHFILDFPMTSSAFFLIAQDQMPENGTAQWAGMSHINHPSRKLAYRPILLRYSLYWGSLFPHDPCLCQVGKTTTIKLNNKRQKWCLNVLFH